MSSLFSPSESVCYVHTLVTMIEKLVYCPQTDALSQRGQSLYEVVFDSLLECLSMIWQKLFNIRITLSLATTVLATDIKWIFMEPFSLGPFSPNIKQQNKGLYLTFCHLILQILRVHQRSLAVISLRDHPFKTLVKF